MSHKHEDGRLWLPAGDRSLAKRSTTMISGLIEALYYMLFDPYPWAFLGAWLELPYQLFSAIGL
jgi:hypothetical protein